MEEPDNEVSDQDEPLLVEESDDVLDSNLNKAEARLHKAACANITRPYTKP